MNGVTGRMGTNQHLIRSIVAILDQGGVHINSQEVIIPDVVLVGRNETKLKALSQRTGIEKWTTNLDSVLNDSNYQVYFDAQTTGRRADAILKAIAQGNTNQKVPTNMMDHFQKIFNDWSSKIVDSLEGADNEKNEGNKDDGPQ